MAEMLTKRLLTKTKSYTEYWTFHESSSDNEQLAFLLILTVKSLANAHAIVSANRPVFPLLL